MTERLNRLSEVIGDTLARLTTDSGAASVVAYLQDYERLVLERGLSPESLVPAGTDVQAIFRLIQDLRSLALDVPQTNARDRFMHQVAIARADYLAEKARQSARRSKANSIAAGVAAVCILAATASVAGATSGLPKVTLPVSLHDIVDSISPAQPASQDGSEAAPISSLPATASDGNAATSSSAESGSSVHEDGLPGVAELRQLIETLQSALLDEQTSSPAASGDVASGAGTSKVTIAVPVAPNTVAGSQGAEHPVVAGGAGPSGQTGAAITQPEPPATPPVDTQPASGHADPAGGQSAFAPGVTGTTPGQTGSTPAQNGASGGGQSSTAPGLTGSTPGLDGSAPGLSAPTPTGPSEANPGQSGSAPGASGASPGQSGFTPGGSGSAPAQSNSSGNAGSDAGESGSAQGASDSHSAR